MIRSLLLITIIALSPVVAEANRCPGPRKAGFKQLCLKFREQCTDVPENKRITCEGNIFTEQIDTFVGCSAGVDQSVRGMLKFVFEAAKALSQRGTFAKLAKKDAEVTRSIVLSLNQLQGYVVREYEVQLRKVGPLKATGRVAEKFAEKFFEPAMRVLWTHVRDFFKEQIHNLNCYNVKAQSELLCKVASDIFVPPAGAFAILKGGGVNLSKYPNLARAVDRVKDLVDHNARLTKTKANLVSRIADEMHDTWRAGLKPGVEKFHPVDEADLLGESAKAAKLRLEKRGFKGLEIDEQGRLVQNINRPSKEVLPSINFRNNGAPAKQYAEKLAEVSFQSAKDFEKAAEEVHKIWIANNEWQRKSSPELFKSYAQLTPEEKIKDLDVVASYLKAKDPLLLKSREYIRYRQQLQGN